MQHQPFSVMIVAEAYQRELLADADRVRKKTKERPRRRAAAIHLRLAAGSALVRIGHRLQGAPDAPGQPGVTSDAT